MLLSSIRQHILDRAIRGQLVPQLPEEGTAEELFQQIQAEKKALIANGSIKKEKPLEPIQEEEIKFDVPTSWKWVKLSEIAIVKGGKRIPAGKKLTPKNTGHIYIRISDMEAGSVNMDNLLYVPTDIYPSISRYIIKKEDVYITVAGTVGRVGKVPAELDGANLTENADRLVLFKCNQDWLIFFLQTTFLQGQILDSTKRVSQPKLALKRIETLHIPLPPLNEQERIVRKIEALFSALDSLESSQKRLSAIQTELTKRILDQAIQGKLVPQLPEEGTAEELFQQIQTEKQRLIAAGTIKKEKPLPSIEEKDLPFDIPETWKWVRWGEIVNVVSARRVHQSDWKMSGVPFYRAREIAALAEKDSIQNELYISDELYHKLSESGIPRQGDVMVTAVGTLGKAYIVKDRDRFYYKDASVICLENIGQIEPKYIKYALDSEMMKAQIKANSSGTTVGTLTIVRMNAYLIPLPPLAEQKRIVAKIEEMLTICKTLQ